MNLFLAVSAKSPLVCPQTLFRVPELPQPPIPLLDCHHVPVGEYQEILFYRRNPPSAEGINDSSLFGGWSASLKRGRGSQKKSKVMVMLESVP